MTLMEKKSSVYLEQSKDDPEGTFVWPIVASAISAGELEAIAGGVDGAIEYAMWKLTLLAAIDSEQLDPRSVFRVRLPFALFPCVARFFGPNTDEGASAGASGERPHGGDDAQERPGTRLCIDELPDYLDDCRWLVDYVQLPKALSIRARQVREAEEIRLKKGGPTAADVTSNPDLLPLLESFKDSFLSLASEFRPSNVRDEQLDVAALFADHYFLEGAFGVPLADLKGGFVLPYEELVNAVTRYIAGRAVAGHPMVASHIEVAVKRFRSISMSENRRTSATFAPARLAMAAAALAGNGAAVWQLHAAGFPPHWAFPAISRKLDLPLPEYKPY